jgi:hypothetical protein
MSTPIEEALTLTATTLRKSGILLEIELSKDLPAMSPRPPAIRRSDIEYDQQRSRFTAGY